MDAIRYADPYQFIKPVVPSGMTLYTDLVPSLMKRNPSLAVKVIAGINRVDRSRKDLLHAIMGDIR